jgi:hypothetical protein
MPPRSRPFAATATPSSASPRVGRWSAGSRWRTHCVPGRRRQLPH